MASPIKRPTGSAITMLATGVFGGLGTAYLPTQMQTDKGWQAEWGPEISAAGLIVVALATVWFIVAHIRWPQWATALRLLRVRIYRQPYAPDQFVTNARIAVPSSLVTIERTVDLKPYGWSQADPFIRITCSIFNGSMYPITFGESVSGSLYVGDALLLDPPMISEGRGAWSPQHTAQLKIDQRMKIELWEQLSARATSTPRMIYLKGAVTVTVTPDYPGGQPTRIFVGIHGAVPSTEQPQ